MMSSKKKSIPFVPVDRQETIRQEIISVLAGQIFSMKDISGAVRISEKEVCEHLQHIRKTVSKRDCTLIITPAKCKKCGFVFKKRKKLKKPGKCPICRAETIKEPLFEIQ